MVLTKDGIKPATKKTGEFFNTHIEKGFRIGRPPLRARLFGKRVNGKDGDTVCSGIMYDGILYITAMRIIKEGMS